MKLCGRRAATVLSLLLIQTWACQAHVYKPEPVPLLLPDQHNVDILRMSPEGVALLSSLQCVAPVVVIGPYRSGKSFTLDQLLQVDCAHGFGVGHTRATQTRGMWLWGQPLPLTLPDNATCSMVLVDTEGFESTGRSTAYDDRIFAISTLLSSLLIYNLPEAIRESDIAKLSFAVQLAEGLFAREDVSHAVQQQQQQAGEAAEVQHTAGTTLLDNAGSDKGLAFEPGNMLWLIQRDFLQGPAADQAVAQALAPVPNPEANPEIDSLNRVRASLGHLVRRSTGFSLPQPHLRREQLCELPDDLLDSGYRSARDALRVRVKELAGPKVVGGRRVTGRWLADLLSRLVELLNQQEMPSVANLLDQFNKQLVWQAVSEYQSALQAIKLPLDAEQLVQASDRLQAAALQRVKQSLLGNLPSGAQESGSMQELKQALARELHIRAVENEAASNRVCGREEERCEQELDRAQGLPALRLFQAAAQRCEARFNASCAGPGHDAFWQRLQRMKVHSEESFRSTYNDRLHTGMLALMLVTALCCRFVVRQRLLEVLFWAGFLFLQAAPHLMLGGAHALYQTQGWQAAVRIWETSMLILGLDTGWGAVVWLGVLVCALLWRLWPRMRRVGGKVKSGLTRQAGYRKAVKDLDV